MIGSLGIFHKRIVAATVTVAACLVWMVSLASAVQVVQFWNIHGGGPPSQAGWEQLFEKYHASQDEIRVEYTQHPFGLEGRTQVLLSVTAGAPPDFVFTDRVLVQEYASTGMFLELTPFVQRAGWDVDNEWVPITVETMKWKGGLYGLPADAYPLTYLVWNKGAFAAAGLDQDRPPVTLAELDDLQRRLTVPSDDAARLPRVGYEPWYVTSQRSFGIQSLLWESFWWDEEEHKVIVNGPRNLEMAEWHASQARMLQGIWPSSWGKDPFRSGNAVMRMQSSVGAFFYQQNQPLDFEWGLASHPILPGKTKPPLYVAGEGYAIPLDSNRHEAAWNLLQWLLHDDQGVLYSELACLPSARISTIQRWHQSTENDLMRNVLESLLTSQVVGQPYNPLIVDAGRVNNAALNSIRGLQQDPQTALADAQMVVQGIVDDYLAREGPWW